MEAFHARMRTTVPNQKNGGAMSGSHWIVLLDYQLMLPSAGVGLTGAPLRLMRGSGRGVLTETTTISGLSNNAQMKLR